MYPKHLKLFILILGLYCPPASLYAQQLTVHGIFFRKSTAERIAQATVTNMQSGEIMMSDEIGGFSIKAASGDTLLFNKRGYLEQKQVVTGANDIAIYLQPIITLPTVTIKGQSTQQELNDVVNTYRSKGLYFDGRPPLWLFSPFGGSPITGFYELFSQDARNERHFIKFSKEEMEAIEVDRRYNKALVKQVTHLPDDEVQKFMQQYRPSFEDIKQWNDYDLINHIKKYLAYYKKHKDGLPSQKLNP